MLATLEDNVDYVANLPGSTGKEIAAINWGGRAKGLANPCA
jgi:hypothetical protein